MATRKTKSSFGRSSVQYSTSASASKLPRSTPLMQSSKKVFSSTSKSVSKRSSYFGGGDKHVQKDTRPIADKAYMRQCINSVLMFLSDYGYPNPVNYKTMSPPTSKEYFRIFEFVFAVISPGYKMVVRPEEETAKVLSDLNYPFVISKSTLSNVGAMSAWPHALGALDWLVDLAKYTNTIENDIDEIIYKGDHKRKDRDDYLKATYTAFMQGKNAPFTEINEKLDKDIAEKNKVMMAEIEEMKLMVEKQEEEKENYLAEKEAIANREQEIVRLQKMADNLEKYLEQLDDYTASVRENGSSREMILKGLEAKIAQMEKSNKDLQATVAGQEITVDEVKSIELEIDQCEKKIEIMKEKCEETQQELFAKQIEQSKLIAQIDSMIVQYTEACTQLELIPQTAANAQDIDYSLSTARSEISSNLQKLLAVIRPKLLEMKGILIKEQGRLQQERNHNNIIIMQLKEEAEDKKLEKEKLQKQFDDLTAEEQQLRTNIEKAEEKERAEQENLKEEINNLKMINQLSLEEVLAKAKEEREKWKVTQERYKKKEEELANALDIVSQGCIQYKKKFSQLVTGFNQNIKRTTERAMPALLEARNEILKDEKALKEIEEKVKELQKG